MSYNRPLTYIAFVILALGVVPAPSLGQMRQTHPLGIAPAPPRANRALVTPLRSAHRGQSDYRIEGGVVGLLVLGVFRSLLSGMESNGDSGIPLAVGVVTAVGIGALIGSTFPKGP